MYLEAQRLQIFLSKLSNHRLIMGYRWLGSMYYSESIERLGEYSCFMWVLVYYVRGW